MVAYFALVANESKAQIKLLLDVGGMLVVWAFLGRDLLFVTMHLLYVHKQQFSVSYKMSMFAYRYIQL